MKFTELDIAGAFVIEIEPHIDERGFFARTWCSDEFKKHGLNPSIQQCNISYSEQKNTLRGMHYQSPPHSETKVVSCTQGRVYDVILDIRENSPTYGQWSSIVLDANEHKSIYIPGGLAHGFQTLENKCEMRYQMSTEYQANFSKGIRWNDPFFSIQWPKADTRIISSRDTAYPDFKPINL